MTLSCFYPSWCLLLKALQLLPRFQVTAFLSLSSFLVPCWEEDEMTDTDSECVCFGVGWGAEVIKGMKK